MELGAGWAVEHVVDPEVLSHGMKVSPPQFLGEPWGLVCLKPDSYPAASQLKPLSGFLLSAGYGVFISRSFSDLIPIRFLLNVCYVSA